MRLRAATRVALAAAMLLAACGGGGDDGGSGGGSGRGEDPSTDEPTTTTTVPAAYRSVVDARVEAHDQYEQARENPTNPENPVLRDHFTGVELLNVIRAQVFNNDGNGNGIGTRYPENSQHRFDIESVTFSDADPNVAWLETCWVDDGEDYYLRTGAVADVVTSIYEIPPIRTVQRTEEMRKEGERWKVARTFINSYQEGVVGCAVADDYEKDYSEQSISNEQQQTITDDRWGAERAYVSYLTDPNYSGYSDTWTGFQHDHYFANAPFGSDEHKNPDGNYCPSDVTLIATSATSGEYRPFYLQDESLNPWRTDPYHSYPNNSLNESPCYNDYQLGQNAWSFLVRNDGRTFDPSSTSEVIVATWQLQSIENPHVAYLTTCRTYNLAPTGQGEFNYRQGTVNSVETMHLVDGAWKVSNRWNFATADACT